MTRRRSFPSMACWFGWLLLSVQVVSRAAATTPKTADDFLVQGLADIEPAFASFDGTMYAGTLPTSSDDNDDEAARFMFWLFVPTHPTVPDTMVMWLNGGPGCSSILGGVLLENSPVTLGPQPTGTCCLDPNAPLRPNPYAWTQATTMLYVEMPTGVGFSHGGIPPQTETDVGLDMYGFLQSFYRVFPQLLQHKLSLFGESYAGYFVPSIARRIALENEQSRSSSSSSSSASPIPLVSIGLGNGWMDATVQGPAVIEYAWWHGMIDAYTRDVFRAEWKRCSQANPDQEEKPPFHSFTTPDECGIMEAILAASGQNVLPDGKTPNQYDVTTFDPYAVIGSPDSTLTRFMNNPKVKEALHAPKGIRWVGCMEGEGRRRRQRNRKLGLLDHDQPVSVMPYVAELLDRWNIRVLIYNGDMDMSTNAQGNELLLNNMKEWSGHRAWKVAGRGIWMTSNAVAGYVKKYSNLTFLVVKNSGHLVPLNQPLAALDLVERHLRNVPFLDIPLPNFVLSQPAALASKTTDPPSESSLDEPDQEGVQYATSCDDQNDSQAVWLKVVDQIVLAIVCFIAGAIASHSWRRKGYEPVSNSPSTNGSQA